MYEELSTPLPDRKRYLERIGLTDDLHPDLATLDKLILAHLRSVPFENLDVFDAETDIVLDIDSLFDKIVTRRRGGYCFELNAMFMSLLKSAGFECYPVMVRVCMSTTAYMPITHRAGIVTIDGVRYFVDVGFGGPAPNRALVLDDRNPQACPPHTFVFDNAPDGDFVIYRLTEAGREQLLKFDDRRCENVDFLGPNEYLSRNRKSGFKMGHMLNISRPDGSIAINGNILRIHKSGQTAESILDTEEKFRAALHEHFGLDVGFPLKI
jgi:N-hydroxyarylamine O-acetyltransferase